MILDIGFLQGFHLAATMERSDIFGWHPEVLLEQYSR